ncbi:hypothetical protein PGT21_004854 [Puccinia graminis f. sp. tritici]|uniref:Uncharacterized protein n=1 Tax=Puccinia graminis f. sp. tritici TaxID=56615 RepID=A0A5B0PTH3_PUCGR|nr:hypothetical protein PGTUg99_022347 [Puccinia graminis f. sp. tritici]KAA1103930.1 hypothetical protein PGT21_004854 [Puccinia graminis f. sp. tritici]
MAPTLKTIISNSSSWQTKELAQIQRVMLQMIRANPDLARSKSYLTPNSNHIPQDDFVLVGTTSRDPESSPSIEFPTLVMIGKNPWAPISYGQVPFVREMICSSQ